MKRQPRPVRLLPSLLALVALALTSQAEVLERVIVRVNGDIVTQTEFEQRQVAAVQAARVAPSEIERFLRDNNARILQEAVDDLLLVQRAAAVGYKVPPSYVNEVVDNIKKENNIASEEELVLQLRREGMTLSDLRRNIERQVLRQQVLRRELEESTSVSEADARAEYQRRRAEYARPATVTLREILIAGEGDPPRARAEQIGARARAGEDFAELARAHSSAPTAKSGGELGQLSRADLAPELAQVAFALPAGGVSEPIAVTGGFRVIKVEQQTAAGEVPFEQVKAELQRKLAQEKMASAYQAYIEGLRKNAIVDLRVREVPLQVSLPEGSLLEAPTLPEAGGAAPAAPSVVPPAGEQEFSTTPQVRPERVMPPVLPGTASPPPPPTPSPSPSPPGP